MSLSMIPGHGPTVEFKLDPRLAPDSRLGPWAPMYPYTTLATHRMLQAHQGKATPRRGSGSAAVSSAKMLEGFSSLGLPVPQETERRVLGAADDRWQVVTHVAHWPHGSSSAVEQYRSTILDVKPNQRYSVAFELLQNGLSGRRARYVYIDSLHAHQTIFASLGACAPLGEDDACSFYDCANQQKPLEILAPASGEVSGRCWCWCPPILA